jgi:glycerol-1-phosphate dehydrogenase [NAD(P)+]
MAGDNKLVSVEESLSRVPVRLEELLGFRLECACGRVHSVELAGALVECRALEEAVWWARRASSRTVAVVFDARTREIAGEQLVSWLRKDGRRLETVLVPDAADGRPHADQKTVELVQKAISGCDFSIAVGAGTINDLVKLASFRLGRPYMVAATAPSMNGYTSAIAAITENGLKKTVECHQPLAVICDLEIISRAPREMIAAGVGDLESKPTAGSDFRLAHWLRGEWWCPVPERVVLEAEAQVAEAAADIRGRDRQALGLLCRALLLSGISMKLAGSSAPASGAEHLISHYWDMCASGEGRSEGLHGLQVGVATLVSSALYEEILRLEPEKIDPESLAQRAAGEAEPDFHRLHRGWEQQAREELARKTPDREGLRAELRRLRDGWPQLVAFLLENFRRTEQIRQILHQAGCPLTVEKLGLGREQMERAFEAARHIRARFTVLDLAWELGLLEQLREVVLARSGVVNF